MPFYRYLALDTYNKTIKGNINANSMTHAHEKLRHYNFRPLSVRRLYHIIYEKLTDFDRFEICLSIAELLKAGIPLAEALNAISHDQHKQKRRILCESFEQAIRFGDGMNAFTSPDFFDDVALLSLLHAEQTGDLSDIFTTLAHYYAKRFEMQNEWRRIIRYPIFLAIMLFILVGILGTFVLPNLETLIPKESQGFAFHSFKWFAKNITIIAMLLFLSALLMTLCRTLFYHIPIISRCRMSNFWESLSFCLAHDIPLLMALDLSKMNLPSFLQIHITRVHHHIHNGKNLIESFSLLPHLPRTFFSLISLAQKTGDITSMITHFSEMEATYKKNLIKKLMSWTQPLLILIMGTVVLWILNATIVPLYDNLAEFTS